MLSIARAARKGLPLKNAWLAVSSHANAMRQFSDLNNIRANIDTHGVFSTEFQTTGQFQNLFNSSSSSNIQEVREGGYIEDKQIDTLLPEGVAGDMSNEFLTSGKTSWMVRDGGKLLCRLIDEYSAAGNKGAKRQKQPQNLVPLLDIAGLTDRKEWSTAQLSVKHFGKELYEPSPVVQNGFEVTQGQGSRVEKCMEQISKIDGGVPAQIMLLGPRGVGKSAMLNQAVVHARRNGWLCLFVPGGWDQVMSGPFIEPVDAAFGNSELFDNSWMTAQVLRGFWRAHANMLREIPISNIAKMSKYDDFLKDIVEQWHRALSVPGRDKFNFIQMREMIYGEDTFPEADVLDEDVLSNFDFLNFKMKSLEDIVLLGVALRDLAGPLFLDLVEELRNLESEKILFAVDQYNTWEGPTAFEYNKQKVYGRQLCVPHALNFISKKKADMEKFTVKNGMCIAASSLKHPEGRRHDFESWKPSIPLTLTVPCYSRTEFFSAVSYYTDRKVIPADVDLNQLLAYRTYTGSTGRLLREQATPYFFPKAVETAAKSLNLNIMTSATNPDGTSIFGDADVGDIMDTAGGDDDEEDWGEEESDELDEKVAEKRKKGGKK